MSLDIKKRLLVEILEAEFLKDGILDLSNLTFSDGITIDLSGLTVNGGDIRNKHQQANFIDNTHQEAKASIDNSLQSAKEDIDNSYQISYEDIDNSNQQAFEDINNSNQILRD